MIDVTWRKRFSVLRNRLYLYPVPEPKRHTRLFWLAMGLVTLAVIVFSTYFIVYLTSMQNAFQTNAEDMGIMDQAIWNTLHGQILHQTVCNILHDTNCVGFNGISRFALHFEPILFPVSLFYLLWSDPRMLQILQVLVVAAGAYPAFWLARLRLRSELAAVAIAVLYLFYPAQQQATASDFHAVTFTASLLLFALYFMYTRRTAWLFVFAILAMACKEEIGLVIIMFGLWSMVFQRRWRSALALVLLGAVWFVLASFVIIPHFSPNGHPLLISRYDAVLGKGPMQAIFSIIGHPKAFMHQYIVEHDHLAYLRSLFAPGGYLPLLAPWVLVMAVPSIALNLLSSDIQQYSGLFQYNAEIVPVLIFSTIEALVLILWVAQWIIARARATNAVQSTTLSEQSPVPSPWTAGRLVNFGLLVVMLGFILFSAVHYDESFFGKMPFAKDFQWPTTSAHADAVESFIAKIPPAASVSAQNKFVPHLSHRSTIYLFPYGTPFDRTSPGAADKADYILLDITGDIYPFYTSIEYINAVKTILFSGQYGVLNAQDGYLLLKRGLPQPGISPYSALSLNKSGGDPTLNYLLLPDLPTNLCSSIYVAPKDAQAHHQLQATFSGSGGDLNLVDFSVGASNPFVRSSGMTVTTYWQVTKPITSAFQIVFLMTGSDGKEYLASTDVPQLFWCQTNTWKPGTMVKMTSRVFTLTNSGVPFGLAHLSIAILPLVQSSDKIMDVQARLTLHVVNAPGTVMPTQGTNALQLKPIKIIP